ncbi:MAG: pyridoxal-phosphate dependent enzyme [Deltaproteobacteria bacterium]|nr:pyridoxal-phosphate dependent enzyme [Deltaproteobacteria bacterium]
MATPQALFELWPELRRSLPSVTLGVWPTPLTAGVVAGREVLFKREDLSAPAYGGNKIRALEMVFGAAREAGKTEIWSTGAYGSNHALAAAVHARAQGLFAGAILWPQPWSQTAHDNVLATTTVADEVRWLGSIVAMPPTGLWVGTRKTAWVMPPGAATPIGAMGHAGAALELGQDLAGRKVDAIVLPIGSTCTTAGLLAGTALAHAAGLMPHLPRIVGVRVTPWPVTARWRIADLAAKTARALSEAFVRAGRVAPSIPLTREAYLARLDVVGDQLGPGYGEATPAAWRALATFAHVPFAPGGAPLRLDTTYSAKAAAHVLSRLASDRDHTTRMSYVSGRDDERLVFWVTKSSVPLPATRPERVAALPERVQRWLETHR